MHVLCAWCDGVVPVCNCVVTEHYGPCHCISPPYLNRSSGVILRVQLHVCFACSCDCMLHNRVTPRCDQPQWMWCTKMQCKSAFPKSLVTVSIICKTRHMHDYVRSSLSGRSTPTRVVWWPVTDTTRAEHEEKYVTRKTRKTRSTHRHHTEDPTALSQHIPNNYQPRQQQPSSSTAINHHHHRHRHHHHHNNNRQPPTTTTTTIVINRHQPPTLGS